MKLENILKEIDKLNSFYINSHVKITETDKQIYELKIDEMAKGISKSKLSNSIFLSHLQGEYICDKKYWSLFARVLIKRGYKKLKNDIDIIFHWLEDLNWPGAIDIFNFLLTIPKKFFLFHFANAFLTAMQNKDYEWLEALSLLFEKSKFDVAMIKNEEVKIFLKQMYQNDGDNFENQMD